MRSSLAQRALSGRGERILVLNEDSGFLELARSVIGKAGYRVTAYSDPSIALTQMAAAPDAFDLVVIDASMPGTTGIDIARQIMAIRPNMPVIITAGSMSREEEVSAFECGVREVVSKAATVEELYMAFNRVFGA